MEVMFNYLETLHKLKLCKFKDIPKTIYLDSNLYEVALKETALTIINGGSGNEPISISYMSYSFGIINLKSNQ